MWKLKAALCWDASISHLWSQILIEHLFVSIYTLSVWSNVSTAVRQGVFSHPTLSMSLSMSLLCVCRHAFTVRITPALIFLCNIFVSSSIPFLYCCREDVFKLEDPLLFFLQVVLWKFLISLSRSLLKTFLHLAVLISGSFFPSPLLQFNVQQLILKAKKPLQIKYI